LRITFVTPFISHKGGIRVVATYARKLTERGHEVFVVSTPQRRPTLLPRLKRRLRGAAPFPSRAQARTRLLDFLGARQIEVDRVRPITDDDLPDADVVVATWWETAEWVAGLSPRKGRKYYLIQDYEMFRPDTAHRVAATYRAPLRKIAVSGWIRDTIAREHGVRDIALLLNAVDTGHFNAPMRSKSGFLRAGFLYTPVTRKNVALAIAALSRARKALPGLEAVAFGSALPVPTLPLPDWIMFYETPCQDEIPQIYAACDLWLFTSKHEGFGLPLLEAMACRTPVLATRAGAAPDLVDGRNGLLLESDPDVFAETMAHFARMPDAQWQTWSEAAWATAQAQSWDSQTDALERLLRAPAEGAA